MRPLPLTRDQVVMIVGEADDDTVARIIETGATREELMEAFAWTQKESDVMGDARRALSGRVAQVYDILVGDEEYWDET